MGKTILTPTQSYALELVAKEKTFCSSFFLAGGTALAEFYIHHRYSEDLDFFTEDDFDPRIIEELINVLVNKTNAKVEITSRIGFLRYRLIGEFGELKLDFVHNVFHQLETGIKFKDLKISSLWDILVDKLYTIFSRATARDFIDFYFAFREVGCSLDQLINAMEEKYNANFDKISLLSRFPVVREVVDYPTMLVSFDKNKMVEFYYDLIRDMEKDVFK